MGGINLVSVSGYNAQLMGSGYGLNQNTYRRCLPQCGAHNKCSINRALIRKRRRSWVLKDKQDAEG